jgi:hypothetical protein
MKTQNIIIVVLLLIVLSLGIYSLYHRGLISSIEKKIKDNKRPDYSYDEKLLQGQLQTLNNTELKYMNDLMDDMIKLKKSMSLKTSQQVYKSSSIVDKFNSPEFTSLVSKVGTVWFNALFDINQLSKIIVAP